MYRSNYIILIDQIWDVQRSTRKQKLSPCCGASWQLLDHGELLSGTDHGNLVLPAIEGGSQKHVLTSVGKSFEKKWWSHEGNTLKYYIFTRWLFDHFWPHYIFTQYCDLKEMILKISMHLISSRIISPVEAQSLSILRMTADHSARNRWNIDEIDWNRTNLPPRIPYYFNVSM